MSRVDYKEISSTPELNVMTQIKLDTLKNWRIGKKFIVSESRAAYLFTPKSLSYLDSIQDISRRTISYVGIDSIATPSGAFNAVLLFVDSLNHSTLSSPLIYPLNMSVKEAKKFTVCNNIPMLIDLDLVNQANTILSGRSLFTRTNVWYCKDDNIIAGLKFAPVTISNVTPGTNTFPLKVHFSYDDNKEAYVFMNVGYSSFESRSFDTLFMLDDIKQRYSRINDNVWALIQKSDIALGMTKEECRLALGNPKDVNAGHNWSQTMDVWQYPNGTFLQFTDGILVNFRK